MPTFMTDQNNKDVVTLISRSLTVFESRNYQLVCNESPIIDEHY